MERRSIDVVEQYASILDHRTEDKKNGYHDYRIIADPWFGLFTLSEGECMIHHLRLSVGPVV
jgi:hypothetical protein